MTESQKRLEMAKTLVDASTSGSPVITRQVAMMLLALTHAVIAITEYLIEREERAE